MPEKKDNTIIPGAEEFFIQRGKVGCLLCHGFTGTPHEMRKIADYLAEKNITVLGPRLPGHGTTIEDMQSTNEKDWYQTYQEAFEKLTAACDEVFIGGLSMGGALSLNFASENDVAGIVTLAAPARLKVPELVVIRFLGQLLHKISVKKNKKELYEKETMKNIGYDSYPIGPARSLTKIIVQVRKNLAKITSPILIIQGLLDARWLRISAMKIFDEVSSDDKEIVLLRNSSHNLGLGPEIANVQESIYQFIKRKSNIL